MKEIEFKYVLWIILVFILLLGVILYMKKAEIEKINEYNVNKYRELVEEYNELVEEYGYCVGVLELFYENKGN